MCHYRAGCVIVTDTDWYWLSTSRVCKDHTETHWQCNRHWESGRTIFDVRAGVIVHGLVARISDADGEGQHNAATHRSHDWHFRWQTSAWSKVCTGTSASLGSTHAAAVNIRYAIIAYARVICMYTHTVLLTSAQLSLSLLTHAVVCACAYARTHLVAMCSRFPDDAPHPFFVTFSFYLRSILPVNILAVPSCTYSGCETPL
jgi:hypothetical protein